MNSAIRQIVKVQPGGVVHFASPELREGTEAEVIVLLADAAVASEPQTRLVAFKALQQSLALTPASAEKWTHDTTAERKAFAP